MRRLPVLALLAALVAAPAAAQQPAPASEDPDAALVALMNEAKADAARIRGLDFLSDLPARRITREEFLEITMRDVARVFGEGDRMADMQELLMRLGVLPEKTDLEALVRRFFPATVAAKYDPFEKEILFLRAFRSKSVMVHELTHALEDQHYNLKLLFETREMTFDRLLALGALAEGDAEDVQQIFDTGGMITLTPIPMIRKMAKTQIASYLDRMKDFPRALARPFIFQYLDGLLFVETIKREGGGFRALDPVYRDPPTTTEQILHPERYLDRDRPTVIAPAPAPEGYRLAVTNVLGELGTSLVLSGAPGDAVDPAAAAAGWDGDRVVLYRGADRPSILAWYTTWDTEEDAEEFAAAATALLRARRPDVPVVDRGGLAIRKADGAVAAVRRAGRDVLVVDGAPEDGFAALLTHLMQARKTELTPIRSAFGASK